MCTQGRENWLRSTSGSTAMLKSQDINVTWRLQGAEAVQVLLKGTPTVSRPPWALLPMPLSPLCPSMVPVPHR